MAWRIANSLNRLRDQVNAAYPNRNKASDGVIGDAAHAASASDHNPNTAGVVTAFDITNSPQTGFDVHALADRLRVNRHPDLKYIISNRRIAGAWTKWAWTAYSGSNPHSSHAHFSVGKGNDGESTAPYDDTTDWAIGGVFTPQLGAKSNEQVASEVLAGQWGNNPERASKLASAGYDAGTIQSIVNSRLGGGGAAPKKLNEVIAGEVRSGAWGNGEDRRNALSAAGYSYDAVQAIVNQQITPAATARTSNDDVAIQVIAGAWGNNPERKARLEGAGYDYGAIQALVNQKLGAGASATARKSDDQIANEIIAGQGGWGTNPQRQQKLQAEGYDYDAVQSLVNRKLGF